MDPSSLEFADQAIAFMNAGAFVITRQGGSLVGGTPEGRVKSLVVNDTIDDARKKFYSQAKVIFDPNCILAPDIKLGANKAFTVRHFRTTSPSKIVI